MPDVRPLDAEDVKAVARALGPGRLAEALCVSAEDVAEWMARGAPAGPAAACLRRMANQLPVQSGLTLNTPCVLCGGPGHIEVSLSSVCTRCAGLEPYVLDRVGLVVRRRMFEGAVDAIRVGTVRTFEQPVLVKFSAQRSTWHSDPELGDEQFDRAVWIETDEYESVFDLFMLERRRQLVFDLTRSGTVTVNVNEVLFESPGVVGSQVPLRLVLLAWSLSHETSDPWAF